MFYLLFSMNKENIVEKTQKEIAEAIGSTFKTVNDCIKELSKATDDVTPFIVRIGTSKYRVNPDIIYIGACDKRSLKQHKFTCEYAKAIKEREEKERTKKKETSN